jgi:hypothetical protein
MKVNWWVKCLVSLSSGDVKEESILPGTESCKTSCGEVVQQAVGPALRTGWPPGHFYTFWISWAFLVTMTFSRDSL